MLKSLRLMALAGLLIFSGCTGLSAREISDIARSVIRISGRGHCGNLIMGTGFLVQIKHNNHQALLVTAAHVLAMLEENDLNLLLRRKIGDRVINFEHKLRVKGRSGIFYSRQLDLDLAVVVFDLPKNTSLALLSPEVFADEADFRNGRVDMGSKVVIPGFPYGESYAEAGFPIARSGMISSAPLSPVSIYKTFLVDFEVFEGYSGAPVLVETGRGYKIAGMTLEEVFVEEVRKTKNKTSTTRRGLGLAKVLNSELIRNFIEDLH